MAWGFFRSAFASGDFVGPIHGEIMADPDYGSEYAMELGQRALEPGGAVSLCQS